MPSRGTRSFRDVASTEWLTSRSTGQRGKISGSVDDESSNRPENGRMNDPTDNRPRWFAILLPGSICLAATVVTIALQLMR